MRSFTYFTRIFFYCYRQSVHDIVRMNRDDRLCWYHKGLARDDAEDLLKNGKRPQESKN